MWGCGSGKRRGAPGGSTIRSIGSSRGGTGEARHERRSLSHPPNPSPNSRLGVGRGSVQVAPISWRPARGGESRPDLRPKSPTSASDHLRGAPGRPPSDSKRGKSNRCRAPFLKGWGWPWRWWRRAARDRKGGWRREGCEGGGGGGGGGGWTRVGGQAREGARDRGGGGQALLSGFAFVPQQSKMMRGRVRVMSFYAVASHTCRCLKTHVSAHKFLNHCMSTADSWSTPPPPEQRARHANKSVADLQRRSIGRCYECSADGVRPRQWVRLQGCTPQQHSLRKSQ